MTKSTKSHLRGFSILLKIFFRVHELVARAMRGEYVRHGLMAQVLVSRSPQPHTTTRANISHEKAEQIRARIVCTPAINAGRAWSGLCADGMESAFLLFLLAIFGFFLVGELTHMRSMCVGVAETGVGAFDDPRRNIM